MQREHSVMRADPLNEPVVNAFLAIHAVGRWHDIGRHARTRERIGGPADDASRAAMVRRYYREAGASLSCLPSVALAAAQIELLLKSLDHWAQGVC